MLIRKMQEKERRKKREVHVYIFFLLSSFISSDIFFEPESNDLSLSI